MKRRRKKENDEQLSCSYDVVNQAAGNDYPNEIARMHVSIPHKNVVSIHANQQSVENFRKNKPIKLNDSNDSNDSVESIWKLLGIGKIDMMHACIGYTNSGNPVLDHEDLVDLLLMYGFSMDVVLEFVDDFAECSSNINDGTSPVVIYRKNTADIHSSIEPIVNCDK